MTYEISRRNLIAAAAAVPAALSFPASARADIVVGDIAKGSPDAPVTVYEYASFTCPHCAAFHINTWPQVKKEYIDTGKVRFILREVYFDSFGLWASIIARCGGERAFYPVVDQILNKQDEWTRAQDKIGALKQLGKRVGLSGSKLDDCLIQYQGAPTQTIAGLESHEGEKMVAWVLDQGRTENGLEVKGGQVTIPAPTGNVVLAAAEPTLTLIQDYQNNATADEVSSTPTFMINGDKLAGNRPFDELASAIEGHL